MPCIDRMLGPMEFGLWFMDHAARSNFIYVAEIKGGLPRDIVDRAARQLMAVHPLLGACIRSDNKRRPWFSHGAKQPETLSVDLPAGRKTLSRFLEKVIQQRLDTENGPLFRLHLCAMDDRQAIILTLHHSVADGICGPHILGDLLRLTDSLACGHSVALPPEHSPSPMEATLDNKYTGFGAVTRAMGSLMGQSLAKNVFRRFDFMPLDAKAAPSGRRQRFILRQLAREDTERLANRAKLENTSIHSALAAAQLLAIAREIPGKNAPRIPQLSLVDMRKRLPNPVSARAAGVFISSAESVHRVIQDGDFWTLSREIGQEIREKLDKGEPFSYWPSLMRMMFLTRAMQPLNASGADTVLRQGELLRPPASIVSNVGRIGPVNGVGSFSVENLYFLMSVSGSGLFAASASTYNGVLNINFTHAQPCISRERARRVADNTCSFLRQACR